MKSSFNDFSSIFLALEKLGVSKENAVYIGDSEVDCITAHNAGIPCIGVTWGFRDKSVLVENGADFIKIMISGLMDFDRFGVLTEEGLPPALIKELVHIAHEEGFSVMAHCNGARTAEAAAAAGLDSVEHGAYLDRDALQAMKENGTVWVPTVSTVGNLRGRGRFDEQAVQAIFGSAVRNIAAFGQMGGLIAVGTDAGAWAVPHGSLSERKLLEQEAARRQAEQEKAELVVAVSAVHKSLDRVAHK